MTRQTIEKLDDVRSSVLNQLDTHDKNIIIYDDADRALKKLATTLDQYDAVQDEIRSMLRAIRDLRNEYTEGYAEMMSDREIYGEDY